MRAAWLLTLLPDPQHMATTGAHLGAPGADVDGPGDLLVLAFVVVAALLVGLVAVERWLTSTTHDAGSVGDGMPGPSPSSSQEQE